jgi:acid phosphatase type 7
MPAFSRRAFLGTTLAGLASAPLFGAKPLAEPLPKLREIAAFQPDKLFLTWQRDPTTTMTVQWIGAVGETTDTNVYFTEDVNGVWLGQTTTAKPFPQTDLKVFRNELTGLKPGTRYAFRIGKESPLYWFQTMPAKATDTITFVSGGDCGIDQHAINNNIQAARQDPMFAMIGGDLGYDNGKSVEVALAFIRNYSRNMIGRDGRLIPMLACLGNHEVDGGYGNDRSKATFFYPLFDGLFTDTGYATLDFGDYLNLVLLDTGHTSPIEGAQADWLAGTLKDRKDHPHVIAVNHVPSYPSYRDFAKANGEEGTGAGSRKAWVPLFEKYRVPVVLEHHDHTFKRTKPLLNGLAHDNGVMYLGDGSWGKLRIPKTPEQLPYLARSSGAYHMSLHRIEGEQRFHLAVDEFGRVMDVCRTGQRTSV